MSRLSLVAVAKSILLLDYFPMLLAWCVACKGSWGNNAQYARCCTLTLRLPAQCCLMAAQANSWKLHLDTHPLSVVGMFAATALNVS
jgi:hypothetical protein